MELYTDTCRHGKFLQNNGSVSERFCIRSTCSKLGSSCPKSFIFPEDDFSIRFSCSLTNGSIVTLQSADKILTPARLPAKHHIEKNPDYCCHGTNTSQSSYLEVLGEGCFDEWRDVATFHQWCHFTPWVKGVCGQGDVTGVQAVHGPWPALCYQGVLCSIVLKWLHITAV